MSEVDGLVEFLSARIAEDAEWARKRGGAYGMHWQPQDHPRVIGDIDPARVLDECEAKRRIILQQQESERSAETDDGGAWAAGMAYAGELAIRDLAAVYADHPDYRAEWKP